MMQSPKTFDWKAYIPLLLGIATIAVGIWQYADKQGQANREPFLRQQLTLLFEASETVATLATTEDPDVWAAKKSRFWVLYWGPLAVVEDQDVVKAMIAAGKIIPHPGDNSMPAVPRQNLQNASISLSHAVRDLILESWNVDLPPLQDEK